MARNFGSTGASSLLRSATAALNKTNTYNDAMASYQFDLSAKTQDDFKQYQDYLNKRISDTQNTDPSKALTLQRTATSANRTFNSAEIGRATTQVEFGNMSNRDKYQQIVGLYQAAQNNGDDNLAQSLFSRLASLSVTIQNEDTANANAATAAGNRASAATKKGYTDAIAKNELGIKTLNAAKAAGQITPDEYNHQMMQFYQGNAQTGDPGILALTKTLADNETKNGDPYGTYNQKVQAIGSDAQIQKYVNGDMAAKMGIDNSTTLVRGQDGIYKFAGRPQSEVTGQIDITDANGKPVLGQDGLPTYAPQYANPQGFADKNGNLNGFQFVSNIYNKRDANGNIVSDPKNGTVAPGTGPGVLRRVDSYDIHHDDPSGVAYFYTQDKNGNAIKKFIGYETKTDNSGKTYNQAIMGNKPEDIKGAPGVKYDAGGVGKLNLDAGAAKPAAAALGGGSGPFRLNGGSGVLGLFNKAGGLLSGLFNRNNQAQAQAAQLKAVQDRVAAQNAAKDAATLAASRQLLPVFRAPAPPPPPKITPQPSQYNLPPLPAPVPLGKTGVSVPSSTGNYQKDVLNLGRSLGGLL